MFVRVIRILTKRIFVRGMSCWPPRPVRLDPSTETTTRRHTGAHLSITRARRARFMSNEIAILLSLSTAGAGVYVDLVFCKFIVISVMTVPLQFFPRTFHQAHNIITAHSGSHAHSETSHHKHIQHRLSGECLTIRGKPLILNDLAAARRRLRKARLQINLRPSRETHHQSLDEGKRPPPLDQPVRDGVKTNSLEKVIFGGKFFHRNLEVSVRTKSGFACAAAVGGERGEHKWAWTELETPFPKTKTHQLFEHFVKT